MYARNNFCAVDKVQFLPIIALMDISSFNMAMRIFQKFEGKNLQEVIVKICFNISRYNFFSFIRIIRCKIFVCFYVYVYLATPHRCIFHCQTVYNKINSYS